jgi:hypothetical protein
LLKVVSMVVGLFLLLASVDNVPDCPELMTKRSSPSASLQIVSVNPAPELFVSRQPMPTQVFNVRVIDLFEAVMPPALPPALRQAADPSPPAA